MGLRSDSSRRRREAAGAAAPPGPREIREPCDAASAVAIHPIAHDVAVHSDPTRNLPQRHSIGNEENDPRATRLPGRD